MHGYILNNSILKLSNQHTYLGVKVTFHNSLSWSLHISKIITKVSRTLNFLKCNLNNCSDQVKEPSSLSNNGQSDRPQLEYAPDVWDSHNVGDIVKLEKVQRTAAC